MSSKLLLAASVSLAQYVSAEVHYGYSGDPNQVGYARDRFGFISLSLSCHINTHFISGQESELGGVAPYSRDPSVGDRLGLCGALHWHRFSLHRVLQEGF